MNWAKIRLERRDEVTWAWRLFCFLVAILGTLLVTGVLISTAGKEPIEAFKELFIGAFFGKGRRTGKYGTLLLATYNDEEDVFPSICKVGTGFTDESLDQLYQILSPKVTLKKNPRIVSEMEADVWFEPELVIEIVASEITQSPIHKTALNKIKEETGLALRFPKFTGKIRTEKNSEDASTDEEVIALYKVQKKTINPE